MNYILTDLYNEFECIADKCPNTCCAGWSILIDKDTRQKMIDHEEELGVPAADWLIEQDGATLAKLNNLRCCMLNEKNLCNVVLKLGPEYLSQTCQQYPRLLVQYGNVIEGQLSMSCPEVISKLMDKSVVQFDFVEKESAEEEYPYTELYLFESEVRTYMVGLLQTFSHVSLETRMYALYKILEKAIEFYQRGCFDADLFAAEIAVYFQENVLLAFEQQLKNVVDENSRFAFLKEVSTVLEERKTLDLYADMLSFSDKYYAETKVEDYVRHLESFREYMKGYDRFYTNYWVCHVFLDAISIPDYAEAMDKLLYDAAEFCLIQSVALATYVKNGMQLSREQYTLLISLICRAMEHNKTFRQRLTDILVENRAVSLAGLLLMVLK